MASHIVDKSAYSLVTPVRPLEALWAMRGFAKNPQDTTQVFWLTDALRGRSMIAHFESFAASPNGAAVFKERRHRVRRYSHLAGCAFGLSGFSNPVIASRDWRRETGMRGSCCNTASKA